MSASPPSGSDRPAGTNPDLYQYRPPIDLRSARLRKLAARLGPAYLRVSGTWANTTYFPESDKAPDAPPNGFSGVLTRQQWKDVVDFARAVDARILRDEPGDARRRRGMNARPGSPASRVHAVARRPRHGRGIHERAKFRGDGGRAGRLRRRGVWT
jgi:hypothetical protein